MRHLWLVAAVMVGAGSTARAGDLNELYRLREGETRRASSADANWQNGNGDCRPIAPGGTLTIADLEGPGIIQHIWFTISAEDPRYGRSLTLRMYWDGEEAPAVESPLGDFFAVGHGALRSVTSAPVAISSDGRAYNCYWPMPFRRHARITLTNDSTKYNVGCVFWYVDYQKLPGKTLLGGDALPRDTAYFHAQYRQEYPCEMGRDYLILDAEGEGHYVGTVLSAQLRTASWFGEGDDRFYIDGAAEPQLRGTGTEDYFCDAWGFRLIDRPYYGVTLLDGYDVGDRLTAYRWHVADPVLFRKSLKVTIEHKGVSFDEKGALVSGFEKRQDLFSSVAFWYQTGRAKRYAKLPPADQRVVPVTTIELENSKTQATASGDTKVDVQDGAYSAGKQLFLTFPSQQARLAVPFELKEGRKGLVRLKLTKSFDYGTWNISLDGKVLPGLEAADLFSPNIVSQEFRLGFLDLKAGPHQLVFECVGKNAQSKGFYLGVDAVSIEGITPYATPGK